MAKSATPTEVEEIKKIEQCAQFVVVVATQGFPVFASFIKSIKGKPLVRYSARVEQRFETAEEAAPLAKRARGHVMKLTGEGYVEVTS